MGAKLRLYDLRRYGAEGDYGGDARFDPFRHPADGDFTIWLHARNAVFTALGPPAVRDAMQRFAAAAGGERQRLILQMARDHPGVWVFARPQDFAAARTWVREYVHPVSVYWDRQRLVDLLDLMEGDPHLWLVAHR